MPCKAPTNNAFKPAAAAALVQLLSLTRVIAYVQACFLQHLSDCAAG